VTHPRRHVPARLRRAGVAALVVAGAAAPVALGADPGALNQKIAASQQREQALQTQIHGESTQIAGYDGQISDLEARLGQIERSLAVERTLLLRVQGDLRTAHARLAILKRDLRRDLAVLADQVVALYESPQPDIVTAVAESEGFSDMLEKVGGMQSVTTQNAVATHHVIVARRAVSDQVTQLAGIEARRQRIADGMLIQRDQVARLRLAVVDERVRTARQRSKASAELGTLRSRRSALERKLNAIEAREAAAAAAPAPLATGAPPPSSGGGYGFFAAAGTNYSMGEEPEIASRLDRMAKALGLHLIGISGYRTPQHSVEVGGFPNDPHTRGEASDTPGVEGVSEATLNKFGLTRPFGGAAEADHIQLVGSI
jgi:peptidoglycan hydrolase CwlO-like protein